MRHYTCIETYLPINLVSAYLQRRYEYGSLMRTCHKYVAFNLLGQSAVSDLVHHPSGCDGFD